MEGTLTIAVGEILKITLVERLFRLTRDRLMLIPTFAILYRHWIRLHEWITSSEMRVVVRPLQCFSGDCFDATQCRLGAVTG